MIEEDQRSSTGLNQTTAGMLAYLAWWVTGLLFLALEKENRYVRFHALQSVVGLGALSLAAFGFWLTSFVLLLASYSLFYLCNLLALITGLLAIGVWILLLAKAFQGQQWKLPFAGDIAERYI